jgi:predicted alpha/beta-hydrolase family hydrolase
MREQKSSQVFLGGHSYGGRQATVLVSEELQLVDGLLVFSYPLHPPRKPNELRISHFSKLTTPTFFVHGTRDPFGTITEMTSALELIPAPHSLLEVDGAGHDLLPKKTINESPSHIVTEFTMFLKTLIQEE